MDLSDTSVLIKALSATGSPVTIADANAPDQPIVFCNDAFIKLSGYSRDEIIGKNCRFLQGEDTDRREVAKLKKSLVAGEDVSVTLLNYTKDGRGFWNDLRVSPVHDDDHKLTHFIGFQNDISARLERERVELLIQKLENEIELSSIEEARLVKLNKIKDDFISSVSRQLHEPATEIKSQLARLSMEHEDPDALNAAKRHSENLVNFIDSMLEVAKLNSQKVILDKRTTDLRELLTEAKSDFESLAKARSVKLKIEICDEPVSVLIDKSLMRAVIDNLVDNAVKYSDANTTVFISLSCDENDISFSVKDEGIGIEASEIDTIFDKFTRSNIKEVKNIQGTGLGLYWVKTITSLHKATIDVESVPGKGSTFTVKFPVTS